MQYAARGITEDRYRVPLTAYSQLSLQPHAYKFVARCHKYKNISHSFNNSFISKVNNPRKRWDAKCTSSRSSEEWKDSRWCPAWNEWTVILIIQVHDQCSHHPTASYRCLMAWWCAYGSDSMVHGRHGTLVVWPWHDVVHNARSLDTERQ